MDHFTVSNDTRIVKDIVDKEDFLTFQKADFDSVWGDFSSDSLSNNEQVLFEQPRTVSKGEVSLWKELEFIQPIFKSIDNMEAISRMEDSGIENGDSFDNIFNKAIMNTTQLVGSDPMVSSTFELATPQHPFEEELLLPEDPMDDTSDMQSPTPTIHYPSSSEEEDAEGYTTGASINQSSPPPTGYPHSIHSYSQLSADKSINQEVSDDVVVDEPVVPEIIQADTHSQTKDKTLSIQNVSPFKSKGRRRQKKSRVFQVTISENTKVSPKKKTFSNGKAKLYALKALADPEMERARQNAINAKKNRELKKKEKDLISREVTTLKQENGALKRSAAAMRKRASDAEAELRRLQSAIRANHLEDIVKAAGNQNKESDKMSYFSISNNLREYNLKEYNESLW